MKFFSTTACLLFILLGLPAFGQTSGSPDQNPQKRFAAYRNTDPTVSHENFFEKLAPRMKIAASDMVLQNQNSDAAGFTHFKYQEFHEGRPVFGSSYILHEKDGVVRTANGNFHPEAAVSGKNNVSPDAAVALARREMKSKKYDAEKTSAVLCYFDPAFPKTSQTLRLAYMVDLHSVQPFDKRRYFVDAATGKILKNLPLILNEGVPSKAKTHYYGLRNIITDSLAPQQFVLRDPTRGDGIFIYNNDGSQFTGTSSSWDLANAANDDIALDAHFCTEKYYDMMLADYNWHGVDGQGGALVANVHAGDFVNAFWDGSSTSFGDGDCNYGPLTTLEVMGHEFTHGMVQFTSGLVYDSESGAINESIADMFGKMLERKVDPGNFSWILAHSFIINPNAEPFRVMNDPNVVQMPAYYKGLFWDDFNDVHVNSSIGNLWFSMVSDGKQGVDETGYAFNVPALGMAKVGQIVFDANRNYMTANSGYNDLANYTIEVAGNLYGVGSQEQDAVKEAWKAVGLPNSVQAEKVDLAVLNPTFSINYVCGVNLDASVTVTIKNSGTKPYVPGNGAKVILSTAGLPDHTVTVNQPIAPGESVDIQVDNWLHIDSYGFINVNAQLDFALDENPINDYNLYYFNTLHNGAGELSLNLYVLPVGCFAESQTVLYNIENNSCDPVQAGAKYKLQLRDVNGISLWTSPELQFPEDIEGGRAFSGTIEAPIINGGVDYYLAYANDPDDSDNAYSAYAAGSAETISGAYFNNFEIDNGLDNYLVIEGPGAYAPFEYHNSNFFAASGVLSDPENFSHCQDPFEVFEQDYSPGINSTITGCIDFSNSPAPSLEFDAALFRSDWAQANNFLYSSMLQVKWEGNETGSHIVSNQPEGVVKHTKVNLPPNFIGTLTLNFYAELGNWGVNPANLATDDYVLLDNYQLNAPTSATHESLSDGGLQIAPNPARDQAAINAETPIQSVRLLNAAGQLLQTLAGAGLRQQIDLKGLPAGLYWVNVRLETGAETLRKLVKMD